MLIFSAKPSFVYPYICGGLFGTILDLKLFFLNQGEMYLLCSRGHRHSQSKSYPKAVGNNIMLPCNMSSFGHDWKAASHFPTPIIPELNMYIFLK